MQNRRFFYDVVQGNYGRKLATYNADYVDASNVVDVLAKTIKTFYQNRVEAEYLWRYKNGDQPILYRVKEIREDVNNKVVENHAFEIVQFKNSQSYGEPIQYVSVSKDETVNKAVDMFNTYMKRVFKFQRNVKQGEWRSAVGTSFLACNVTNKDDSPISISVPTPLNTYVVYKESDPDYPLCAIQILRDIEGHNYYLVFTENESHVIKNGKVVDSRPHIFGGIPIVEVPNNQDRLSDVEIVITLLDSINLMQSDRMNGIVQFVQAWIKFVNCDIDEETFQAMKEQGALCVKSNNGDGNKADVDVMSSELNQSQAQIAKDDIWDNSLSILAIPNKEGNTGGDTQGAVTLRNGWDHAKSRAKLSDAYIIEGETKFARICLNVFNKYEKTRLDITTDDFEVNIPHSPQDNMSVKANVLSLLLQAGIHPLVAIRVCGLWSDPENVYLQSIPYLEKVIYKNLDQEIANMPDGKQQMEKANNLVSEYQKQSKPTSRLKERLLNAIEG